MFFVKSNLSSFFKLIIANLVVLLVLLIAIETIAWGYKKFILNQKTIGWFFVNLNLDSSPCLNMTTHPILSHVSDHKNKCEIFGGYAIDQFVFYEKEKDKFPAIITLGGSTTSGFYQHFANGFTFPYILNELVSKNNYQVINGGLGDYSSTQELYKIILDVRRLNNSVKFIISLNGINDLPNHHGDENIRSKVFPFMTGVQNSLFFEQKWYDQRVARFDFLPNTISLIRFISRKLLSTNFEKISDFNKNHNIYKKIKAPERWLLNVKAMESLAKQMDAKYFVFIQPTMGLLGVQSKLPKNKNSKDYKLLTELIKNQKYILELNNFYNSIRVYCKKLEFCFDISNEASPKGNFYTDPRHHNKDGNKIIAEKIYKIISKEF